MKLSTRKTSRPREIVLALLLAAGAATAASAPPNPPPARSAGETYLTYLDVCGSLTNLSELKPYLPKAMGDVLVQIPRDMQGQMISQSRKKAVSRVKVVSERKLGESTILDLEGRRGELTVHGWAKMIVEDGHFKVAKDDWTGTPAPAPPKIPPSVGEGKAAGEFTVEGQTARLQYASARELPDSADPSRKGYEVTLSDLPWDPGEPDVLGKVRAGTLHFVQLSISADRRATGVTLDHSGFIPEAIRVMLVTPVLELDRFGPDVVSGKAYVETFEESRGQKYYFAATFRARVEKPAEKPAPEKGASLAK